MEYEILNYCFFAMLIAFSVKLKNLFSYPVKRLRGYKSLEVSFVFCIYFSKTLPYNQRINSLESTST